MLFIIFNNIINILFRVQQTIRSVDTTLFVFVYVSKLVEAMMHDAGTNIRLSWSAKILA
jgi:hypothetical protein